MAKTIDYLEKMMPIARYEHEGFEYDTLNVGVSYKKGVGFFVCYQPVKRNTFGGFLTGPLPSSDPLVKTTDVLVENADKNSEKKLRQMMANVEAGQNAVAWLFGHREFDKLNIAIVNLARNGYTESYRQQMERLMQADKPKQEESKTEISEPLRAWCGLKKKHPDTLLLFRCGDFYEVYQEDADEVSKVCGVTLAKAKGLGTTDFYRMAGFPHHALDTYLPRLIRAGNRVAICDEITINNNSKNSEDKDMRLNMNANKSESANVQPAAQVDNNPIEDAQAVEITTEADVQEVDDIAPKVTKRAVAQAKPAKKPAVTMPLGKHGTLVIAGVESGQKSKVQDSVPAGKLIYATYEKTKVNKTTKKEYTVTHAKIMGFAATDEAYQRGVELHGAVSGEMVDGVKVLGLYFSHRYAAAAKDVCDALNAGKPFAECVAIIDNATEENARKREEWKAKIEERKQKREERKAEKTNTNRTNDTNQPTAGYSAQDVAAMLQKVLAGGELPKDVEALMKKAA